MPRWLTVALFALALAVQAIAPVANGVAAAHDATGLFEFCQKATDAAPQQSPGHTHRHHQDCALCQAFCDGVAPVAGRPVALAFASLHWSRLAWAAVDFAPLATARDVSRQARAPPRFA
ncbi:DUF2946 family protein [Methylocystis sp. IM3]|uniref:DUF2946 family protein n=1 Tax=unclassified Methylocystis TaxID=2625913 RepID=UPI0030FAB978